MSVVLRGRAAAYDDCARRLGDVALGLCADWTKVSCSVSDMRDTVNAAALAIELLRRRPPQEDELFLRLRL